MNGMEFISYNQHGFQKKGSMHIHMQYSIHTEYVVLLSFRNKPFLASFFQSKNLDCSDHCL